MTNYVNWLKTNQVSQSGSTIQTQGNPVSNDESPATGVASGVAPDGANYAMCWADVGTRIEASPLYDKVTNQEDTGSFTIATPANTPIEIVNVIPGKTVITMTDI